MNIKTIFRSLIDFFTQAKIDYAVVGAFALKAYGYLRATQDVDFLVRSTHQDIIISFLESLGYETIYRSAGYSNHVHPLAHLGRIDLIYVEGTTADTILSESRPLLILDDISVPVVKAEHLIALKVFAMKNDPERSFREMADLQHILKLPNLDLEEVRGALKNTGNWRSMPNSPNERKRSLNLEKDWKLTERELEVIGELPPHVPSDLGSYLDFLDELWGDEKRETRKGFYPEPFLL